MLSKGGEFQEFVSFESGPKIRKEYLSKRGNDLPRQALYSMSSASAFVVTFVPVFKNKKRKVSEDGRLIISEDRQFLTLVGHNNKYIKRFFNKVGTISVGNELILDGYEVSVEAVCENSPNAGSGSAATVPPPRFSIHHRATLTPAVPPVAAGNTAGTGAPKSTTRVAYSTSASASCATADPMEAEVDDDGASRSLQKKRFLPSYTTESSFSAATPATALRVPLNLLRRLRNHQVLAVHFLLGALQGHSGTQAQAGPEEAPQCFFEASEAIEAGGATAAGGDEEEEEEEEGGPLCEDRDGLVNTDSDSDSDSDSGSDSECELFANSSAAKTKQQAAKDRKQRDLAAKRRLQATRYAHTKQGMLLGYSHGQGPVFRGAVLADEMGLGKSFVALAVAAACVAPKPAAADVNKTVRKTLFVCPASLVEHWAREARKLLGVCCAPVLVRSSADKEAFLSFAANNIPFAIISYEMARKLGQEFGVRVRYLELLVCDEGHRLKNAGGSATELVLRNLPAKRRLLLTGTPVQNDLDELHAMVSFVAPGYLGSLGSFRARYAAQISRGRSVGASAREAEAAVVAEDSLRGVLEHILLRRTQTDVLRVLLPPRSDVVLWLDLTPAQQQQYQRTKVSIAAGEQGAATVLTALQRLRRHCNYVDAQAEQEVEEEEDQEEEEQEEEEEQQEEEQEEGEQEGEQEEGEQEGEQEGEIQNGEVDFGSFYGSALEQGNAQPPPPPPLPAKSSVHRAFKAPAPAATDAVSAASRHSGCVASTPPGLPSMFSASRKLQVLDALLRELRSSCPGEKVVIVSNFTGMLARVQQLATARNWATITLTGATRCQDRQSSVERFNRENDPSFLFLLSARAGGAGISLVGGSRLVALDCDWNPAVDLQALARCWREGQTKPVFVYRMVTRGTIEQTMLSRQYGKGLLAKVVGAADAGWSPAQLTGSADLTAMVSPPVADALAGLPLEASNSEDGVLLALRGGTGAEAAAAQWIARVDQVPAASPALPPVSSRLSTSVPSPASGRATGAAGRGRKNVKVM